MDQISIPIPDGIDERQKADLRGWLTELASQVTKLTSAMEDDVSVRAEVTRRIKAGMADIEAERFCDSKEAIRRIAERHGLTLPA